MPGVPPLSFFFFGQSKLPPASICTHSKCLWWDNIVLTWEHSCLTYWNEIWDPEGRRHLPKDLHWIGIVLGCWAVKKTEGPPQMSGDDWKFTQEVRTWGKPLGRCLTGPPGGGVGRALCSHSNRLSRHDFPNEAQGTWPPCQLSQQLRGPGAQLSSDSITFCLCFSAVLPLYCLWPQYPLSDCLTFTLFSRKYKWESLNITPR